MCSNYDERKTIFGYIKLLVESEQEDLFRIIRKSKENYTENSNGIFFDLSIVSDDTFSQIKEYINYCLKIRQEDSERLKELEAIRLQNEQYNGEPEIA